MVPFWFPFASLWLNFGSLWIPFGSLLVPFGMILQSFDFILLYMSIWFIDFIRLLSVVGHTHFNLTIHIFTTTATNEKLPARRFWARMGRSRDADPLKNIILMHVPPARLYENRHGLSVSLNIPSIC